MPLLRLKVNHSSESPTGRPLWKSKSTVHILLHLSILQLTAGAWPASGGIFHFSLEINRCFPQEKIDDYSLKQFYARSQAILEGCE